MAKDKKLKTNAMRILDSKKVSYDMLSYESEDGKIDGISVAHKIGVDEKNVFKTLVAQGTSKELYVFVIPVAEELDLKNAASSTKNLTLSSIYSSIFLAAKGNLLSKKSSTVSTIH